MNTPEVTKVKKNRGLSGIYFRYQNPETGKFENWCFEDLPRKHQLDYLNGRSQEWLISMIEKLSDTLNEVSEKFNIERS